MNKKLIIGLSIFFILISVITNNANASLLFEPFEAIYMTNSYGSTTPKTIFNWNTGAVKLCPFCHRWSYAGSTQMLEKETQNKQTGPPITDSFLPYQKES